MAQKFLTNIDLNKNELQNAKIQNLGTAPSSPEDGQVYFDTGDNALKVYDGTAWVNLQEGDISGVTAGTGLSGGGTSGTVTINLANTAVTAGSYGSATAIPTFTVDAQGRLTAVTTASISTTLAFTDDSTTSASVALNGGTLSILGGTGVSTTANDSSDSLTIAIGQAVGTTADVTFNSVAAALTGNVTGNADTATALATARTIGGVSFNGTANINLPGVNTAGNQDTSGNAATATALATARTIALSGSVTATGVAFDGTGNISLTTAIAANSVALGTTTTGDYVQNLVAGTGVSVSVTSGEGQTPTVAIGQAVGTSDNVTFNDLIVSGDLTVNGTSTTINTATLSVEDPLIILASGNNTADAVDIGFYGLYDTSGTQDLYAGLFRDASDNKFRLFKDLQVAPTTTVNISGTGYAVASLVANIEGDITGNAGTATALETARTIGGVSFNGTANINLPGVNASGTQDTSGNAATATALATARTVNGVSFDGTANITVTAAAGTLTGTVLKSTVVTSSLVALGTIATGVWAATDVAVAHGGTGASTAAGAKTNLGFMTRYAATIGDNSATAIAVTHSLGSDDVIVEVYDASTKETVVCDVDRTSANEVTLTFSSAPATNALRVVIIG